MLSSLRTRWRFAVTIPRLRTVTVDGVRLDVDGLAPLMKNRLYEGRYEVQERALCRRFLSAHDQVLEVGAALGFLGLWCRRHLGVTTWHHVEANPDTAARLERCYRLNGHTPRLTVAALAAGDGTAHFDTTGDFWCHGLSKGQGGVAVTALGQASLLARTLPALTALVVDIEGGEIHLDPRSLPASIKVLVIELHPDRVGPLAISALRILLAEAGFKEAAEDGGTVAMVR